MNLWRLQPAGCNFGPLTRRQRSNLRPVKPGKTESNQLATPSATCTAEFPPSIHTGSPAPASLLPSRGSTHAEVPPVKPGKTNSSTGHGPNTRILSRHGHHFALSHGNVAMPRFGCHVEVRPVKPGKTKIPSPSAFACPPQGLSF